MIALALLVVQFDGHRLFFYITRHGETVAALTDLAKSSLEK
jgi:hypothetical protein